MEIEFLYDEELERKQKELEQSQKELEIILRKLKNPELTKRAMFLKEFTKQVVMQYQKQRPLTKEEEHKKQLIEHAKERLSKVPLITKPRLRRPKPIPIQPIQQIPVQPKPLIKKLEEPKKIIKKPIKKDLITDKFTKKTLATANIDSKYIVREPELDENDQKALTKIIKKKPKNMKKAWKLIERYKKKFKLQEGHENNLKYYVVNRFFTMGKVEPLLHDEKITQISCKGVGKPIVVIRKGKEYPTNLFFKDADELTIFLEIIKQRTEQKLDKKHPSLDATHRDFHIHVTFGIKLGNSKFIFKRI